MGGVEFAVLQRGADLQRAFTAACEAAARRDGWRENSGTIATKTEVHQVHQEALDFPTARNLSWVLLRKCEGRFCFQHDVVAAAIPLARRVGGRKTGWLFFGIAND